MIEVIKSFIVGRDVLWTVFTTSGYEGPRPRNSHVMAVDHILHTGTKYPMLTHDTTSWAKVKGIGTRLVG